ncbi:MAG TPA: PilT/PilU family type 4a pilus ATPase [Candidatus Polarisedimenticolaceae bacterium]|nr:PilT/PilU family type 4a pilus ATPase [Candidatus Polarisedimenticolaceae bacterium]
MQRLNPDPELDDLVRKLNSAAREAPEPPPGESDEPDAGEKSAGPRPVRPRFVLGTRTPEGTEWLGALLGRARAVHASDLFLVAGAPPVARVNGRLAPLGTDAAPLYDGATDLLCAALLPEERREEAARLGTVDFSFRDPELGRFRCNVHRERGRWSAAVRLFPSALPELEALNLPAGLARFAELEHGLVLVTGPTGCGKSTTLAALVRRILARRRVHLITIEDPVEYEHAHPDSVVEHVEIGRDATGFARALRAALRQDPDVLLIGEMRDLESISIAITAAETGHLVLSTLHTGDAPQSVHRILDGYPANQMDAVRTQLSISLAGVISQQLLPRKDGQGRVPAVEVLLATPAVRHLIRQGKVEQLRTQLTLERGAGMLPLDLSLAALVRDGLVDAAEARLRARVPEEFDRRK